MEKTFVKNMQCYRFLRDELLRIIEGGDIREIEQNLDTLPRIFTVEDLRTILSRSYILYEGFSDYISKKIELFLAEQPLAEDSKEPIKDPISEALSARDGEKSKTQNTHSGAKHDIQIQDKQDKSIIDATPSLREEIEFTGFSPESGAIEKFHDQIEHKLKRYKNIKTVNYNLDYQMDIYAENIDDTMHKELDAIREELQKVHPNLKLQINLKIDRRNRNEKEKEKVRE